MRQSVDLHKAGPSMAAMIAQNTEKLAAMQTNELNTLAATQGFKGKPNRKKLLVWLKEAGQCIS